MRLLAIESSTNRLSVAWQSRADSEVHEVRDTPATHARVLNHLVAQVMERSGEPPDAIVAGVGPGSFTALRIGLACAKGLAVGWGIPVYAVPSLRAVPWSLPPHGAPMGLLFDARKGQVFGGVFDPGVGGLVRIELLSVSPDEAIRTLSALPDLSAVRFGGDAFDRFPALSVLRTTQLDPEELAWPRAAALLHYVRTNPQLPALSAAQVEPLYFRPSDAELNGPRVSSVLSSPRP
jgi:tRNA threonylcarbamoyl adenosine modification protein YeaZ